MPAAFRDRMSGPQRDAGLLRIVTDTVMPGRDPAAAKFEQIAAAREFACEATPTHATLRFEDDRRKPGFGANAACGRAREPRSEDGDVGLHHSALRSPLSMLISAALPPDAVVSIEQTRSVAKRLR